MLKGYRRQRGPLAFMVYFVINVSTLRCLKSMIAMHRNVVKSRGYSSRLSVGCPTDAGQGLHDQSKHHHQQQRNYQSLEISAGSTSALLSRSVFLKSVMMTSVAVPSVAKAAANDDQSKMKESISSFASTNDANSWFLAQQSTLEVSSSENQSAALEESISGFIAGAALVITKTVVKYPLDTATVRLQMPSSVYSIWDLQKLFDGCYRGVIPPLLTNVPAGAVFFAVKDAGKATLTSAFPGLPRWLKTMLSVGVAQFPYWAVRNPSEVVKTRQQAGLPGYVGEDISAWSAYKKVRDDAESVETKDSTRRNILSGFDAFYVGYLENILYAYPADVIKFVAYDQITGGRKNLPPAEGAVAGALSTAVAQFLTTPLDVVRNRLMTRLEKQSSEDKMSYIDSLYQLAQEEGLAGLFAGVTPRIGKALVSGAIQFATYEETKQDIAKIFQQQNVMKQ